MGVDYVFVAHPAFDRPDGLYGGGASDLQWRFALLSLAGLEAPLVLDLPEGGGPGPKKASTAVSKYGEDCVFVANDWHAAMVPVYLAGKFRPGGVYGDARCVLAIHNLRHQGVFAPGSFGSLHLPGPWYGALEFQYPPHQRMGSYEEEGRASEICGRERGGVGRERERAAPTVSARTGESGRPRRCLILFSLPASTSRRPREAPTDGNWNGSLLSSRASERETRYPLPRPNPPHFPHARRLSLSLPSPFSVNTLKGGITTADRIVTVSPGYAYEITTPEGGWGMEV